MSKQVSVVREVSFLWSRILIVALTLLLLLVALRGLAAAGSFESSIVIAGSHPVYVPDTGSFDISKQYAYSEFVWNEQGFINWLPEAYEHEFLVQNTGFAKYSGHWSSNLPRPYSDVEDVTNRSENTYDEFVIGSDNAEATLPRQRYWIYLGLSDQDSAVATSTTILEAEHNRDVPWPLPNYPMGYFNIRVFAAPQIGTWNLTASSATSVATVAARGDRSRDQSIGEFVLERTNLLRELAAESPAKKMRAIISLRNRTSFVEAQSFLGKNRLRAKEVWYDVPSYQFGGGFTLTGSISASVERVIADLQENIAYAQQKLMVTTEMQGRSALKTFIDKQQMMIETMRGGAVMLHGIEVEAPLNDLSSLLEDPLVSLVDLSHLPVTPGGVRGARRPIHPAEAAR